MQFRDRGVVLTPEHLSRMGQLTSDTQGRVTFRSKWLDMRTRDPAKGWSSAFFFVRNYRGLLEKWGKMRDLPAPLHVGEEDILRLLKVPDVEHLLYEVRYLNKYIEEEFLFKVGLSFHVGRSDTRMLKPTSKVPEPPIPAPKVAPKLQAGGEDHHVLLKKKKLEGVATSTSKFPPASSPIKFCVHGDVLSHQCVGRRKANDLAELAEVLNEWNTEFVKIKYLQGEYKRKYDHKAREANVLEEELCGCRTEMANIVHSEATLTGFESSRVIEDFKKSIAFKIIIQDHIQEARDHIYEVEVKALEQQCIDEGFIQGFLKGVRLVQRKTGVEVEGLTPSQASDDFPPDSDGDEIETEL
ncbi:hypothetical protein IEQ34_001184 [Dendrobium chrysotoxum]|uniref:Uncharacterized protein n=1 Tax=Dendrobium chrysotoxum TaxID=161865 RepID=A0AAV7HLV3_DENCH|nr:hypothetical protein IEQ34_001184 [Dendrobium chrysotoxum]